MAQENNFSLQIIANGQPVNLMWKNGNRYFALRDQQPYEVRLRNDRCTRCDVELSIDGESVGIWRILPYSHIQLRRPANLDRQFVFVRESSKIAQSTGIVPGDAKNGLISARFIPEVNICMWQSPLMCSSSSPLMFGGTTRGTTQYAPTSFGSTFGSTFESTFGSTALPSFSASNFGSSTSFTSGATVLGGFTGQNFHSVEPITNIDEENVRIITARLVCPGDASFDPFGSCAPISISQMNMHARVN